MADRSSFGRRIEAPRPSIRTSVGFSTLSVHAGEARQKPGDSITDPIFCASTYTFPDTQSVIDFIEQELPREEYGRYGNPSEKVVESKLAALDEGESAVLFSSGMAAFVSLLMAKLNQGDEVIFFDECYHRSREFCTAHLARFGVVTHQVPACDYAAMEAAITPRTRLLVSESPTNPHLSVVDIERFAALGAQARRRNADRRHARARPTTSARWRPASTTCCTRPRNIWAGTTICWPA